MQPVAARYIRRCHRQVATDAEHPARTAEERPARQDADDSGQAATAVGSLARRSLRSLARPEIPPAHLGDEPAHLGVEPAHSAVEPECLARPARSAYVGRVLPAAR